MPFKDITKKRRYDSEYWLRVKKAGPSPISAQYNLAVGTAKALNIKVPEHGLKIAVIPDAQVMKDVPLDHLEHAGKFSFKLSVVKIGRDTDGDEVTTCVVEHIEDNALNPELSGPQRELLDALVKLRGATGTVSKTEVSDCMPKGATPAQKRALIAALETKMYLRPEGKGWTIAERGPLSIFD